ncbi:PAS domain-containing protein [Salipiger profundus]|nr:PAS domain-containing protein [Salipiger profundus]
MFDRKHRLVLFNPALIDLTRLSAEFLSGRPNLLTFFDMLREQHMMPEPKDYGSWREHLQDVINAASSDHYVETWNLPSGLTYRITGRPHPDAGIAFLIEDISAEISLTRGYRQEIEITQSVLETLEDAVVVFSQLGHLTFCNAAYRALWGDETEATISATDIAEATRSWQSSCHPSPIWGDLREFVLTLRDRAGWDAEIHTIAGERLFCRAEPLAGGATLVRFSPMPCGIVRQCRNVLQSHA